MNSYCTSSDRELLALLRNGDHAAYTEIYQRYWALLYRNAKKMIRDEDEADDIVQEVFAHLWEKAPLVLNENSLSSYLYMAVRNKIINRINRNKLKTDYLKSLGDFLDEGEYITDEMVRVRELAIVIEKEIASLPEKMRIVFELSRKNDMSYKEIAEKVNISEGTVKKQIYNAIKILRVKFGMLFLMGVLILFTILKYF